MAHHPDLDYWGADNDPDHTEAAANADTCVRCGTHTLPADTIYDEEQLAQLGEHGADPYCTTHCLEADAEAYSDHTYGRTR